MTTLIELAERASTLHEKLATCHPSLSRGQVWCRTCGRTERVNSAECLRSGWPKCCGRTMTIDSPDEQRAHAAQSEKEDVAPNAAQPDHRPQSDT